MNHDLVEAVFDPNPVEKVSIDWIPNQKFLVIHLPKDQSEFQVAVRIGILKYLSRLIRRDYSNSLPRGRAPYESLFEKNWRLRYFETNKDEYRLCKLMIRQPAMITGELFEEVAAREISTNYHPILKEIEFVETKGYLCAQSFFVGWSAERFDTLAKLDEYLAKHHYEHSDHYFREIYLSGGLIEAGAEKRLLRYKIRRKGYRHK